LANLNQIVLPLIDLTKYLENTTLEFPIVLPEGVTNLTGVDHVQVSIQLPEMAAKPFVLTQFKIVDIPDGMEVEVLTQQLAVTMRGPQSQIDALSAEDLEVIVSSADAEVGTEWISVKIQVVSGYDVSAVGSYSVSATIRVVDQGESG
jgi:YbbR domain-containing protein